MVREYIVKIADDVTEDDDVLYGKPAKELIRCKDCAMRKPYYKYCTMLRGSVKDDFFCGFGKPKEGDGDG